MFLRILDYVFLFRFALLTPVWTILLYGYFQAKYINGSDVSFFLFWPTVIVFSLFVGSFYIFNQLNDLKSDKINNKLFILAQNIISVKKAKIISISLFIMSLLYSLFVFFKYDNFMMLFSFFVAGFVGIAYNLPPFNWKNRPWLGLLADSFGHGMIAYFVGWSIVGSAFSFEAFMCSLALTFGNGAIFLLTVMVDKKGDEASGKNTFVVKYGERKTVVFAFVLILLAFLTAPLPALYTDKIIAWLPLAIASFLTMIFYLFVLLKPSTTRIFNGFKYGVFFVTSALFVYSIWYLFVILSVVVISKYYYKKRFNKNYPTIKAE